jgi:O-acetyl-ADP-ribose deacetylase (regulator of RNase III)
MPFGEKPDVDGNFIDFDTVYNHIIRPPVEKLGIECIRADKIERAGQIHKDMFEHIHSGDVAIVDITTLNANVFYELGVRHSLRPAVTILVRKKGTKLPFNIQGMRVIEYDLDLPSADEAKIKIEQFVTAGLKGGCKDSPVLDALPQVEVTENPKRLDQCRVYLYELTSNLAKRIAVVTGDIRNVKQVADVWVNNENTNMQMARFYDGSISAIVRYLGAKKDQANHVEEDTIADELAAAMGSHDSVEPATVLVTSAGNLSRTHGVKKIFHAASHQGQLVTGYHPIGDVSACVTAALEMADLEEQRETGICSILFTLIGTRQGQAELQRNAGLMLRAAISHLLNNPESRIETVYFLAYTDRDLATCLRILEEDEDTRAVSPEED